jgi:hypothetical protein
MANVGGLVKTWSYSTYTNFQKCPRITYLDKVLKYPRLPLDPPEGKAEHPLTRGLRIHDAAEAYVTKGAELIPELMAFETGFESLRKLVDTGKYTFIVEAKWAFNDQWQIAAWDSEDAWIRMLLDCGVIHESGEEAVVIDYKSGRRYGNEITHLVQGQLYQLSTFLRYPEVQHVTTEFWYTDQKGIASNPFTRKFGMRFLEKFDEIGKRITSEVRFDPKPSAHACKYCPFGPQYGTGDCEVAYK